MAMAGLENVAIYGRFRSSSAEVLGPELCRFLDAGNNEALAGCGKSRLMVAQLQLTGSGTSVTH